MRALAALFIVLAVWSATAAVAAPVQTLALDDGWSFRLNPADASAKTHAEETQWRRATVPGVVQTDLLAAGRIPDPFQGANEAQLQWIGLSDWVYRRSLFVDGALLARRHVDLVFDGLDTFAEVRVNDHLLITADNQHRRWRADVKPLLKLGANEIEVRLFSPIKRLQPEVLAKPYVLPGAYDSAFGDEPEAKQTSTYVRKSPYHYGWDWGPRYVTEGIWGPVRLEAWDEVRLDSFQVTTDQIGAAAARVSGVFEIEADHAGPATLMVTPTTPDGQVLAPVSVDTTLAPGLNHIAVPVTVPSPQLWYPAGYGAQPLYRFSAQISEAGAPIAYAARRVGLRTVVLRREPDDYGKSFTFVVNGVPIFAKGANLIPFDSFTPRVTPQRMRAVLTAARDANMNMLRVWGGGIYQPDAFYDMADEMGLMIWQEFMFGGAITPYDVAFRENARIEAEEQVRRLGDHASIVIWCGNNEVQTGWEHWDDRIAFKDKIPPEERDRIVMGLTTLFGQTLRGAVDRYAPQTPYWATSPGTDFDGPSDRTDDGDQHFWKVWGGAPVEAYLDDTPRFMSEYGRQSMPDMRTIRAFARGDGDLAINSPVIRAHQKYAKGEGGERILTYIRRNYGEPKDFDSFVYLSQAMQAEGIELAALHHRASRPRTMGSLYWQLNDVWPGASWSSLDYYGRWKALQYHARRFFAPVVVSAQRKDGVTEISLISDRQAPVAAVWRLRVMDVDGRLLQDRQTPAQIAPLSAGVVARLDDAALLKGADPRRAFAVVDLTVEGQPISRAPISRAPISRAPLSRAMVYFVPSKDMTLSDPVLSAQADPSPGGGYVVTVHAAGLARAVWIDAGPDAALSDNAFDLSPGETRVVTVKSTADLASLRRSLSVRSLWGATVAGSP